MLLFLSGLPAVFKPGNANIYNEIARYAPAPVDHLTKVLRLLGPIRDASPPNPLPPVTASTSGPVAWAAASSSASAAASGPHAATLPDQRAAPFASSWSSPLVQCCRQQMASLVTTWLRDHPSRKLDDSAKQLTWLTHPEVRADARLAHLLGVDARVVPARDAS